ncbi:MAG TPA: bifunctional phosphoribosyl-AMP cyclohydrolase/phosphoribosyl-ATP diphosphatase HisIE [Steroidobacteraceae bacterium]|nr:bifunctional phosphoribosyl-AMP cyclohydrolase/phosphoribosyl-ATP diphosphatase HisIE [Steroidobacteraceae bacterium]
MSSPLTLMDIPRLDFAKGGGLLPAVVQHAGSGAVLMVGFMNADAVRATLERGRVVFFSRTRQRLWEKGETSGHGLELVEIASDCDADTLLVTAWPQGPVCHTGARTCFGAEPLIPAERIAFLSELERIVAARCRDRPDASYTARLLGKGPRSVAQKVGEEGLEVALAGFAEGDERLIAEAADLLFHLIVLLASRKLPLARVVAELEARHSQTHRPPDP